MSLREVDLPANASLYLCGPLPFMKNIRNEAINAGIPATKIHYEVFGPDIWLASQVQPAAASRCFAKELPGGGSSAPVVRPFVPGGTVGRPPGASMR